MLGFIDAVKKIVKNQMQLLDNKQKKTIKNKNNLKTKTLCEKELIEWMQAARIQGIGDSTFHSLLKLCKTPKGILEKIPSLRRNTGKNLIVPTENDILREIELVHRQKGRIITSCQAQYSQALAKIKDPPPVITIIGNADLLNTSSVAIVGARSATINSCIICQRNCDRSCRKWV